MPLVRVLAKGSKSTRRRRSSRAMKRQMLRPKIRVRGRYRLTQPVHYFSRFMDQGTITTTPTVANTFGVVYFQLDLVPGYQEFKNMYDFYKINAVSVRFIPLSNVSSYNQLGGNSSLVNNYNRFISAIDYNDRVVPTSLNDIRQYANCRVTRNNIVHKRFFHPRPTIAVDEDSSSGGVYNVGQTSGRSTWISTASDQCEWYGIKYGIEHEATAGEEDIYKIETKVYMSFKGRN